MILYVANHASVIYERMDQTCVYYVPKLNCSVIRARGNHSRVKRKLRTSDPILVPWKALNELPFVCIPHLDKLIITSGYQQGTISVERDAFDGSRVTLHDCASGRSVIAPNSDCLVSWAGGNQVAATVYCNVSDWSFMALELVWACVWTKTPSEDQSVIRTRNDLLKTWMEDCLSYSIFVTLECLEQGWILEWGRQLLQIVGSVRHK